MLTRPKTSNIHTDTRLFSNFNALQHPNRAFPERGSSLNNDQFAVLQNILSVVGFWDTLYISSKIIDGNAQRLLMKESDNL